MVDYRQNLKVEKISQNQQQEAPAAAAPSAWVVVACLTFFPLMYLVGKTLMAIV